MTKIKINSQRAEVSSEEIKSRRDFNAVLKEYKTISKPFYKKNYFVAGTSLLAAAAIITTLYLTNSSTEKTTEIIPGTTSVIPERAFISPAFSNLEIAYENLSIAAEKGGTLKLKSGSLIKIPAKAFTNEDGTLLSGTVEIRYREFRDAVDILVGGIPMHYDSAGTHRQLESAGMFEILGFQNGKKVSLAKNITVEMASATAAGNFNQYYLDTTSKGWKYLRRDKIVKEKPVNKPAILTSESFFRDTLYADPDSESNAKISALNNSIATLKKEEPVKPTKAKLQLYRFDLDVLPEEFPELTDYKGLQFEVGPENKTFTEKMYTVDWDDVKLNYNTPGKNYKIAFIKDLKTSEFTVYPVYLGKDSAKVMALYQKKFIQYQKKLNEKITAEKKAQEELVIARKKREDEMKAQQKKYAEAELKRSQAVNYSNIRNVFAVSNFGVYNSDCPFAYDNQVSMTISFTDEKNKPLPVDIAYLIDAQRNSLFAHYYNNSRGYRFNYNPETSNTLFSVNPKNELWVFLPEDFKTIQPVNGRYAFKMKKCEKNFASVNELKAYLLPGQNQ